MHNTTGTLALMCLLAGVIGAVSALSGRDTTMAAAAVGTQPVAGNGGEMCGIAASFDASDRKLATAIRGAAGCKPAAH